MKFYNQCENGNISRLAQELERNQTLEIRHKRY